MNALPQISHRMFVAAIGQEVNPKEPDRTVTDSEGTGLEISLEILEPANPATQRFLRRLQGSAVPRG